MKKDSHLLIYLFMKIRLGQELGYITVVLWIWIDEQELKY